MLALLQNLENPLAMYKTPVGSAKFTEKSGTIVSKSCPICKGSCPNATKCKRFQELSYEARRAAVREFRICRKCLRQHGGNCNSKPCGVDGCTFKHNALLHKYLVVPNEREELFRYLPVTLFGSSKQVECYAFLDDGSELTLLDEQIACDLELSGESKPLCLRWTGGTHRFEEKSRKVDVGISGSKGERFDLTDVRTVDALELPLQSLNVDELKAKYKHLEWIQVESYNLVRPRILIGLKHANVSLVRRCREGKLGEPIAVKTHLGWTIFGGCSSQGSATDGKYTYHICACNLQSDDRIHQEVKQYFGLDSLGIMSPPSDDHSNSNCLQRRLSRDDDLKRAFTYKLAEYQTKGYVRKVNPEELVHKQGQTRCLPTFPVINPNKPGKIRVVWDAAASVHGVCLNSVLLTGPDMMTSLVSVLLQFREHRIAICGDIREMFLQIGIRPTDQFYQLFLWWDDTEQQEPSTFVVEVMIFGARSSPTTAQFVKNHNAQRFEAEYPAAAVAIINNHYVDDMLASTETEEEAIELAKAVKFIHAQGGFEIRNWTSNSCRVLKALNEEPTEEKNLNLSAEMATENVLGMWWNTSTDCFMFKICYRRFDAALFDGSRAPTKRELLRIIMTVFDPLGLISHFLMILKVTLQEVWRIGLKWDEQITGKQFESWKSWVKLLPKLEDIQIPRCFHHATSIADQTRIQMHTFVDAGENGMAAVVYLRFEEDGLVECVLVVAKTRVTPLRYLSIPRSELQAAVIGTRLANTVIKSLSLRISQRYFWCDSRNVLCWLRSDHRRYSQYVATRISEVLDTTEIDEWHWIQSEWNLADDGTKWTGQVELKIEDRWFLGPGFLKGPEESWPKRSFIRETTDEEIRSSALFHGKNAEPVVMANNYSRWMHLVRVTAYVQRFVDNVQSKRKKIPQRSGPLTNDELRRAQEYHFHQAQRDAYAEELRLLVGSNNEGERITQVTSSSKIHKLSPFLDPANILRMNSRAAKCIFLFPDEKYPIILPDDHPVTHLVLADFHERTNFVGASKELHETVRALDKHQLSKEFTTASTSWRFNPPATPHMGGSWERLVPSVKRNLTEILRSRRPTDEELRSALTLIEGVLNSRPLTEVPVDNESEPALTPNHFLLGSSDGSKPFTLCDDNVQTVRRGWQVSQVMANAFWKRWLRNYLPEITKRSKWFKKVKPISVGDIVVIWGPEHPRNCWPKGKVICIVEKGGQVRRATVQTSRGVYERPAVKLAVLDIWSESV
ncbi:uncharacterized protein LOC129761373 [Toxorhynchites rutilus septentrionalis]|uniref:uncharacterized protein LOC129761373 n=1 Tax=Toxorhynchites rutilus septentrionalis TaxID=329112 RepID=UPI002479571A|nr:uncharacterized protein LOC129761373 [Toxorhynchites rutilus septentrionalis]